MPGLVCMDNYGPAFGMSNITDVCVKPECSDRNLYGEEFCTPECPCGHGGGDCDVDADCLPGFECAKNVGASYGQPPDWDICVPE
jgi:hypothetical protein